MIFSMMLQGASAGFWGAPVAAGHEARQRLLTLAVCQTGRSLLFSVAGYKTRNLLTSGARAHWNFVRGTASNSRSYRDHRTSLFGALDLSQGHNRKFPRQTRGGPTAGNS